MGDRSKFRVISLQTGNGLGQPQGTVNIHRRAGLWGDDLLGGLMVESTEQRKGIGRALINRAEEVAAIDHQSEMIFAVSHPANAQARAFFEAMGYTEMTLWQKSLSPSAKPPPLIMAVK